MTRYEHTQHARGLALTLLLLFAAVFAFAGHEVIQALPDVPWYVVGVFLGANVLCGWILWVFSRMTITVDDERVRWEFAGGFAKPFSNDAFSVTRSQIRSVRAVPFPFYYGIGIHGWPRARIYNIALGRGVEITRKDGFKVYLGSDDADALVAAIAPAPQT